MCVVLLQPLLCPLLTTKSVAPLQVDRCFVGALWFPVQARKLKTAGAFQCKGPLCCADVGTNLGYLGLGKCGKVNSQRYHGGAFLLGSAGVAYAEYGNIGRWVRADTTVLLQQQQQL